jgi:hypothetical protein
MIGENDSLVEKIEDRKLQRIRSGACKRERAQHAVTEAPRVLSAIMTDDKASPKHRIDSAKVLDQLADNGAQSAAAAYFNIVINLGADADGKEIVERYSKPFAIGVEETDSGNTDTAPQDVVAAIAMKKDSDDDGQGHL